MSKKIMKRSLALGALMAFVITGSAMAAPKKGLDTDFGVSASNPRVLDGAFNDGLVNTWNGKVSSKGYPTGGMFLNVNFCN